ncbi:MAG: hypothetical protein K2X93_20610 [Candidatus Obscuribacterales bacterium]|nr:hypothetical protein [Candidatus Obscuribacterales bacterium]
MATILVIFSAGGSPAECKTFSGTVKSSTGSVDEQCFEPGEIKTEKQLLNSSPASRDSLERERRSSRLFRMEKTLA